MTSGDKKIIVLFIAISIIGFIGLKVSKFNGTSQNVVIKQENNILMTISIPKDGLYEFNFDDNIGFVEVKNKSIRMLPMEDKICPKGICSDTGWINRKYESIVCLPNKLIVSLESNNNDVIDEISN